jgi:histidyl-tRNA synthetase
VLRSLDKLDRLGWPGVTQLLGPGRKDESGDFTEGAGLGGTQIAPIRTLLEAGAAGQGPTRAELSAVALAVAGSPQGEAAVQDLEAIASLLGGLGLTDEWALDTSVVRGLGYYTGPVFEAELLKTATYEDGAPIRFGSVGGGGRYDDLVARFTGQLVPATGFSFGVSRFAAALRALDGAQARAFRGPVVVLALEDGHASEYFRMAQEIRDRLGVPAEVYVGGGRNMGKQLKYADRRGAPVAVIMGSNEREAGQVTVKNLALGAEIAATVESREEWREQSQQETVARGDMVAAVARALG